MIQAKIEFMDGSLFNVTVEHNPRDATGTPIPIPHIPKLMGHPNGKIILDAEVIRGGENEWDAIEVVSRVELTIYARGVMSVGISEVG